MSGIVICLAAALACAAVVAEPLRSEAELDREFRESAAVIERQAREVGAEPLAAAVHDWDPPLPAGKLVILDVPSRLERPAAFAAPAADALWNDFVAARRRRAEGLFALALDAARAHAKRPDFAPRGCEAIRLLARTLHDDPDYDRGRRAGGWVKRGETWMWPEVARRLDKGEEFSAMLGWLPRGRKERGFAGTFASDHWQIRSPGGLDAAARLAADLEATRTIWLQAYGAFQFEPAELERRFEGRGKLPPHDPFRAVLAADRGHYIAEMEKVEPLIGKTLGIYWTPTRTSWFFVGPEQTPTTVHHEATHQLFSEMRKTSPLAGERCGFWAIEAAACFMESLVPAPHGWTLGGIDAGRAPAARERLLEDEFYVPLVELTAMGRTAFQADERLPQIYSQISGLADFFMNGESGRYREAFVEYLVRIYTGTVDPDTLERLCKTDYPQLDEAYRRHMAR